MIPNVLATFLLLWYDTTTEGTYRRENLFGLTVPEGELMTTMVGIMAAGRQAGMALKQ